MNASTSVSAPLSSDTARLLHLLEIQRRISAERDLNLLSKRVMQEITAMFDAERSTLFLFDWEAMELRTHAAEGMDRSLVVPLHMGIVGTAILRREVMNVAGAYRHPFFNSEIDASLGYTTDSLLVAPMISSDGRVLGGVELINKLSGRFTAEDEAIVVAAAARIGCWIENGSTYPAGVEAEIVDIRNQIRCDRGTVFGLEARTGRLVSIYADGGNGRTLSLNMKLGIAGMVAVTGRSVLIEDAWNDPRFDRTVDQRTGYRTRSMLCVPLKNGSGQTVGVVQAINRHDGGFTADDLATLEAVAGVVAIAVESAMLFSDYERQFRSLLSSIAASYDAAFPSMAGHAVRCTKIALAIGRRLGLSIEELDLLEVASMLHDFGMMAMDVDLLEKTEQLTDSEFELMKSHARLTEDLLHHVQFTRKYRQVPLIAASHHETPDGNGYPRGMVSAEIPFMSRIIAVADAYTAMLAPRPYRAPMTLTTALAELKNGSGSKFDSHVVAALVEHLEAPEALAAVDTPGQSSTATAHPMR